MLEEGSDIRSQLICFKLDVEVDQGGHKLILDSNEILFHALKDLLNSVV